MRQVFNGDNPRILLETTWEQDALMNSARLLKEVTVSRYVRENGYRGQLFLLQVADSTRGREIIEDSEYNMDVSLQLPESITFKSIDCIYGALFKPRILMRFYRVDPVTNITMLNEYLHSADANN